MWRRAGKGRKEFEGGWEDRLISQGISIEEFFLSWIRGGRELCSVDALSREYFETSCFYQAVRLGSRSWAMWVRISYQTVGDFERR